MITCIHIDIWPLSITGFHIILLKSIISEYNIILQKQQRFSMDNLSLNSLVNGVIVWSVMHAHALVSWASTCGALLRMRIRPGCTLVHVILSCNEMQWVRTCIYTSFAFHSLCEFCTHIPYRVQYWLGVVLNISRQARHLINRERRHGWERYVLELHVQYILNYIVASWVANRVRCTSIRSLGRFYRNFDLHCVEWTPQIIIHYYWEQN